MKNKPAQEKTETKMLNTRLPKDLIERVKVFCVSAITVNEGQVFKVNNVERDWS